MGLLNAIPLDMILLTVGALGLGTALTATGAGQVVGDWLSTIVGGNANNYVLGALFFLIPFPLAIALRISWCTVHFLTEMSGIKPLTC